jgi:hypothetical protein
VHRYKPVEDQSSTVHDSTAAVSTRSATAHEFRPCGYKARWPPCMAKACECYRLVGSSLQWRRISSYYKYCCNNLRPTNWRTRTVSLKKHSVKPTSKLRNSPVVNGRHFQQLHRDHTDISSIVRCRIFRLSQRYLII